MLTICERTRLPGRRTEREAKRLRYQLDQSVLSSQCQDCDRPAAVLLVKFEGGQVRLVCHDCAKTA